MKKIFFLPIAIVALMVASCGQTTEEVTTGAETSVDSVSVEVVVEAMDSVEEVVESTDSVVAE